MTDSTAEGQVPERDIMGGAEPDEQHTDVMGGQRPGGDEMDRPQAREERADGAQA